MKMGRKGKGQWKIPLFISAITGVVYLIIYLSTGEISVVSKLVLFFETRDSFWGLPTEYILPFPVSRAWDILFVFIYAFLVVRVAQYVGKRGEYMLSSFAVGFVFSFVAGVGFSLEAGLGILLATILVVDLAASLISLVAGLETGLIGGLIVNLGVGLGAGFRTSFGVSLGVALAGILVLIVLLAIISLVIGLKYLPRNFLRMTKWLTGK